MTDTTYQPAPLRTDAYSRRVQSVLSNARTFAEHRLTQELDDGLFRAWWCARPRSGTYSFRVVTAPGWLYLSGDIGHLALSRERDMLPWTRSVVTGESVDLCYLAEKTPRTLQTTEFNYEEAYEQLVAILDDSEFDADERGRLLRRARSASNSYDWQSFCADYVNRYGADQVPESKDYSASLCWQVLGLRRFFELLDA